MQASPITDIIQILNKALELLQSPHAWTQLVLAKDANGMQTETGSPQAQCFCIAGSVYKGSLELKSTEEVWQETLKVLNLLCRNLYQKGIEKHGTAEELQAFSVFPLSYTNDALIHNAKDACNLLERAKLALQRAQKTSAGPAATPESAPPAAPAAVPVPAAASARDEEPGEPAASPAEKADALESTSESMQVSLEPVEQSPAPGSEAGSDMKLEPMPSEAEPAPAEKEAGAKKSKIELPKLEVDIPFATSHGVEMGDPHDAEKAEDEPSPAEPKS